MSSPLRRARGSGRLLAPALLALLAGCLDTRLQTFCDAGSYAGLCTLEATSLSPSEGPIAGSTVVTIVGHGFDRDTEVTLGGQPATILDRSNEQVVVRTPPNPEGAADVVVSNSLGSATLPSAFRYAAPPTLTGVTPTEADRTGGTQVTVSGTHLTGAQASIGGKRLTGVVAGAAELTGVLPVVPRGPQDVVVTTAGGTATLPAAFLARAWNRSSEGWQEARGLGLSAAQGSGGPLYLAANGGDLYRTTSTASGWERTWTQRGVGFHAVSVSPADPARVLSASRAGIFLTTDGFATVQRVFATAAEPTIAFTADGSRALAGGDTGILLSRDAGASWVTIPMAERIDLVATAHDNSTLMVAASFTRLFISRDGGESWETRALPEVGVASVEATSTRIALGDQTSLQVTSPVAGSSFASCDTTGTATGLVADPGTPGRLWETTALGAIRFSDATSAACTAFTGGPAQSFTGAGPLEFIGSKLVTAGTYGPYFNETAGWTLREAGLQAPSVRTLAVGTNGTDRRLFAHSTRGQVYRRGDDGSWAAYGPTLGASLVQTHLFATPEGSGYRLLSLGSTLRTLAPGGAAWVASAGVTGQFTAAVQDALAPAPQPILVAAGAAVFRSVDGGATFTAISSGLPSGISLVLLDVDAGAYFAISADGRTFRTSSSTIQWIELPAFTAENFIRGFARAKNALLLSGGNAGVFRLDDGAVAWTASGTANFAAENLRADPRDRSIVYIKRGGSFQQSTDNGLSWASVNDGAYPEGAIEDSVVDPLDGRVYLLGDTPLFESVAGGP